MTNIHEYFELTYANYLVLHRTLLQAMPEEWQEKFGTMLEELREAWRHEKQPEGFRVETGRWVAPEELSDRVRKALGISSSVERWLEDNPDYSSDWSTFSQEQVDELENGYDDAYANEIFYSPDGQEIQGYVFVPLTDPIDHYRHPRRYTPSVEHLTE